MLCNSPLGENVWTGLLALHTEIQFVQVSYSLGLSRWRKAYLLLVIVLSEKGALN